MDLVSWAKLERIGSKPVLKWRKLITTPNDGLVELKIWKSRNGEFKASWIKPGDINGVKVLKAKNIRVAKREALEAITQ